MSRDIRHINGRLVKPQLINIGPSLTGLVVIEASLPYGSCAHRTSEPPYRSIGLHRIIPNSRAVINIDSLPMCVHILDTLLI